MLSAQKLIDNLTTNTNYNNLRDYIVKISTWMLIIIRNNLPMDLEDDSIDLLFIISEILHQRTFNMENTSAVYQLQQYVEIINNCGYLSYNEISNFFEKWNLKKLKDLQTLFPHYFWHKITSGLIMNRRKNRKHVVS